MKSLTMGPFNPPSMDFKQTKNYLIDLREKGFYFDNFNEDTLNTLNSLDLKLRCKMLKMFKPSVQKNEELMKISVALHNAGLFNKVNKVFKEIRSDNKIELSSCMDEHPLTNYFNQATVSKSFIKVMEEDITKIFDREKFSTEERKVYERIFADLITIITLKYGSQRKREFLENILDSNIGQLKASLTQKIIELFAKELPNIHPEFVIKSMKLPEHQKNIITLLQLIKNPDPSEGGA